MMYQSKAFAKSAMTFVKYVVWFAVAAALDYLAANLAGWEILPQYKAIVIPALAAALKTAATFWATKKAEYCGEVNQ